MIAWAQPMTIDEYGSVGGKMLLMGAVYLSLLIIYLFAIPYFAVRMGHGFWIFFAVNLLLTPIGGLCVLWIIGRKQVGLPQ